MKQWLNLMHDVINNGYAGDDRTGVGTVKLSGQKIQFENSVGFPAVTTKKLMLPQVVAELYCFIQGYKTLDEFNAAGCTIWDANCKDFAAKNPGRDPNYLGPIYGAQWRDWGGYGIDQLKELIKGLKENPTGRRHVVSAWEVADLPHMCLPPCHIMFQAVVRGSDLDILVYMRSCDLFLGLPFDVASYAILQRLIAMETGLNSANLIFFLGDAHVYLNHLDQVKTVLAREPLEPPLLSMPQGASLFQFDPKGISLVDYQHHGFVKAEMNV